MEGGEGGGVGDGGGGVGGGNFFSDQMSKHKMRNGAVLSQEINGVHRGSKKPGQVISANEAYLTN